jgi:hypothetical protein
VADIFQGSALPNVSTTQTQATTTPSYYTNYLGNLASQGQTAAQNAQYVGPTALQNQAFQNVAQNVGNYQPDLTQAQNLTNQAAQGPNINQFMNPYTQDVVNQIGVLGQRNIQENLSPQATAGAVGTGQFGSQRGAQVLGNTLRDAATNITAQQQQALQQGYTQALQAAQNQQQLGLSAGSQLANLGAAQQNLGLNDVNALATLGGQQQQIGQNQQLFPLQALTAESGLLKGLTVPTSTSSQYSGPMPGAYAQSPLQQVAGLGSILQGLGQSGAGSSLNSILSGSVAGNALNNLFTGNGLFGSTGPIFGSGGLGSLLSSSSPTTDQINQSLTGNPLSTIANPAGA